MLISLDSTIIKVVPLCTEKEVNMEAPNWSERENT